MKIINKLDLTILEESKKGTLILSNDDYKLFGFENRPFNLTAKPFLNGVYEVNAVHKHTFSPSKGNVTNTVDVKIVDLKSIKKVLNITDDDISEMFGYKSKMAYANSSAKKRIEEGLVNFYVAIARVDG